MNPKCYLLRLPLAFSCLVAFCDARFNDDATDFHKSEKLKDFRNAPMVSPSSSTVPSQIPSVSPSTSSSPSNSMTPSSSPSVTYFEENIAARTRFPTGRPTMSPVVSTKSPVTARPTNSPTTLPPTTLPTMPPTTLSPTTLPTHSPSTTPPTFKPTQSPTTSKPTTKPSKSPTTSPTNVPTTLLPSTVPTQGPTTQQPTFEPTKKNIATMSASPIFSPTALPTGSPTDSPTRAPATAKPSPFPTRTPTTSAPTRVPTLLPTQRPTRPTAPTAQPTVDCSSSAFSVEVACSTLSSQPCVRRTTIDRSCAGSTPYDLLTFSYQPGTCSFSTSPQFATRDAICQDLVDDPNLGLTAANDATPVTIRCRDIFGLNDYATTTTTILEQPTQPPDTLQPGQLVLLNTQEDTKVNCTLGDTSGSLNYQWNLMDVSGEVPLTLGDRFGSLKLQACAKSSSSAAESRQCLETVQLSIRVKRSAAVGALTRFVAFISFTDGNHPVDTSSFVNDDLGMNLLPALLATNNNNSNGVTTLSLDWTLDHCAVTADSIPTVTVLAATEQGCTSQTDWTLP